MSVRARLLIMLVLAIGAAATAVATAGNGDNSKQAAGGGQTATVPKPPAGQPSPPPVRTQTTPAPPRPIGDVPAIDDLRDRHRLEAFIAERPELAPWKEQIWYVAHYSYSNVSARGLAGMIWCIVYRIPACSRAGDANTSLNR